MALDMRRSALFFLIMLAALPTPSSAEEKPYLLEKIVVTPSRLKSLWKSPSRSIKILDEDTLGESVYTSIPDAIGNLGNIDMRRRGPEGVQADVSIRGTTFEQNTMMIDGVRLNDPQTGHYNMDLPITMMDVERIEILKGPVSSLYGPNSFGGAINIITKSEYGEAVLAEASGGSFDYFSGAASITCPIGPLKNRLSFEERRSSGYIPETEFNTIALSNSTVMDTPYGSHDFFFGYSKKDFGADSFYSNLFPNEEEHTDTRFFKLGTDIVKDDLAIDIKLFLKRHWDKYALDRNRPGWQTNYHTAYNYGGEITVAVENPFMDVACGFELSRDTIDSTNIQQHRRTRDGIYVELSPHIFDRLFVDIGMREDRFSDFGWDYAPSLSARYDLSEGIYLRSAIGRSYRIPTFTDLYYGDIANIGNADLKPESSWTYEAGLEYAAKAVSYSVTLFRRNSYDTIDWTRSTSKDRWRATNIGSVGTNGLEISLSLTPKDLDKRLPLDRVFLDYTALDSYRKHDYLSKYALDYLKHHISGGITYTLFDFRNSWALNYKRRIKDSGFIVVDTKVSREIFNMKRTSCEFFFEVANLFDTEYSEQSDIPMPGRTIRSGARLAF